MTGRFTNLPERLRQQSDMVGEGQLLELGESLAIASTMRDAALKIEALERDLEARKARKARAKLGRSLGEAWAKLNSRGRSPSQNASASWHNDRARRIRALPWKGTARKERT